MAGSGGSNGPVEPPEPSARGNLRGKSISFETASLVNDPEWVVNDFERLAREFAAEHPAVESVLVEAEVDGSDGVEASFEILPTDSTGRAMMEELLDRFNKRVREIVLSNVDSGVSSGEGEGE